MITQPKYTEVVLKALELHMVEEISPTAMMHPKIDIVRDIATPNFLAFFRAFVWADDRFSKRFDFECPATWWDGLKRTLYRPAWLFPAWWRKRWPAKINKTGVDVECLYPEFSAPLRGHKHIIRLMEPESCTTFFTGEE